MAEIICRRSIFISQLLFDFQIVLNGPNCWIGTSGPDKLLAILTGLEFCEANICSSSDRVRSQSSNQEMLSWTFANWYRECYSSFIFTQDVHIIIVQDDHINIYIKSYVV